MTRCEILLCDQGHAALQCWSRWLVYDTACSNVQLGQQKPLAGQRPLPARDYSLAAGSRTMPTPDQMAYVTPTGMVFSVSDIR